MTWRMLLLVIVSVAIIAGNGVKADDDVANDAEEDAVEAVAAGSDQPDFSFGMVVNSTAYPEEEEEEEEEDFVSEVVKLKNIAIFIRSQHNPYHKQAAEKLKQDLLAQAGAIKGSGKLDVVVSYDKEFPLISWSINPLVNQLKKMFARKKWIFFCEETTEINLEKLLLTLGKHDSTLELFLGHALRDDGFPKVIHHFYSYPSFEYPDFDAGWALTLPMMSMYVEKLRSRRRGTEFSIDVKHEIALLLFDGGNGVSLTDVPEFCIGKDIRTTDCATTTNRKEPECNAVPVKNALVAVKTYHKFHDTRLPIVKNTVGLQTKHIRYYSDLDNATIPTVSTGTPNTERGHCEKTYRIVKRFHDDRTQAKKDWLVIIDDDTIMNLNRLLKVLGCYNPKHKILLGERYGFGLRENKLRSSYDYPTGGGGMMLSRAAVKALIKSGHKCRSADGPDDMWLGSAFASLGIPTVHTNSLHQAPPTSYSPEFLSHRYLVSFHKHNDLNPMEVYSEYLADD